MKWLFLLLALLELSIATSFVDAQSTQFYQGGWKTDNTIMETTLTDSSLAQPQIFRISSVEIVDNSIVEFQILTDGVPIAERLQEGGSMLVEGKTIRIRQMGAGTYMFGSWGVVQDTAIEFFTSTWKAFPQLGGNAIVAKFQSPREFVLSFQSISTGCSNGRLQVFIDGFPVLNGTGNTQTFLQGSSVIGYGKKVNVIVTGNCSPGEGFYGELRCRK